jgi:hypothetical protein
MPEPVFMKLLIYEYIMAPEPISATYVISLSSSFFVSVCEHPLVARQWLGKNVAAARNSHATIDELLDASFSVQPMSYQREVRY